MKFKLDENIGTRGQQFLTAAGHDVSTVHAEELSGKPDEEVFRRCGAEGRALITLDHDFGHAPVSHRKNRPVWSCSSCRHERLRMRSSTDCVNF